MSHQHLSDRESSLRVKRSCASANSASPYRRLAQNEVGLASRHAPTIQKMPLNQPRTKKTHLPFIAQITANPSNAPMSMIPKMTRSTELAEVARGSKTIGRIMYSNCFLQPASTRVEL